MTKIVLTGWQKDDLEIETLEVNMCDEGYVYLRMTDKQGKTYETGMLKEVV
jgi:hypothetical protein